MDRRVCLTCLLVVLCHSALVVSFTCPTDYRQYSCTTSTCGCLSIYNEGVNNFADAESECVSSDAGLVVVRSELDRQIIVRYLEVLAAEEGEYFWTGYRYNAGSSGFVDAEGGYAPTVVTNNIGAGSGSGSGSCLSIGASGEFRSDSCEDTLARICLVEYDAPKVLATSVSPQVIASSNSVALMCNYTGGTATWRVRREDSDTFEDVTGASYTQTQTTSSVELTISNLDASSEGSYACVVTSAIGTVQSVLYDIYDSVDFSVSPPSVASFELSYEANSGLDNSIFRSVPLGVDIAIVCRYTSGLSGTWYINGREVDPTTTTSNSTTLTIGFEETGVYECRARDDTTRLTAVQSIVLVGEDGTPGVVRFLSVVVLTQTSIEVEWFPPELLHVNDPLLLRYRIAYGEADTFKFEDSATRNLTDELIPDTSDEVDGAIHYDLINALSVGTRYSVAVLAVSSTGGIAPPLHLAAVTTYGEVPTETVIENLVVSRTSETERIFADWDEIKTQLPVQPVGLYEVQYRNSDKRGAVNMVYVDPDFTHYTIAGVKNIDYEVRVRAAFQISDKDEYELKYGFNKWTPWQQVKGVINETVVPPDPPTVEPVSPVSRNGDDLDDEELAAVIIGPFLLFLILAVLIGLVIFGVWTTKKRGKAKISSNTDKEMRERVGSGATLVHSSSDKPPLDNEYA